MSYEVNNTQPEDAQLSDVTANADLELSDEDLEAVAGGSNCYGHDHHKKKHHHHNDHHDHHKKDDYYSSDYSS
jgi:hypothetical protein